MFLPGIPDPIRVAHTLELKSLKMRPRRPGTPSSRTHGAAKKSRTNTCGSTEPKLGRNSASKRSDAPPHKPSATISTTF